ncbi:hypothetical protein OSB04_013511 [Centaurea solstitialis]|uniref:Polyprotein n=1 Tax=Centaurea solstitialis TaxID=347529 RepID=A0AA38TWG4_9ASTR|nr:hypothetical protein OSB04_013511 [Centaurea solstitialis]
MADNNSSSSVTGNVDALPFSTLLHMITIKLSSTNYLLWKTQVVPLLSCQKLIGYVDGTISAPPQEIDGDANKKIPNPAYATWQATDQRLRLLLQSSLTEEATAEIIGLNTSREIWTALATAYSHDSMDRAMNLKTELAHIRKGTDSISTYGRKFKACLDQLSAIGRPLDDIEQSHLFLRGLGPSFASFSTAIMAVKPLPSFRELLSQAESHDLFQRSMEETPVSNAAFITYHSTRGRGNSNYSRGGYSNRFSGRGGRGSSNHQPQSNNQNRRRYIPTCQLCEKKGHIAKHCKNENHSANLAQSFSACSLNQRDVSDWYVDSGASAHMTNSTGNLDSCTPYSGHEQVSVGDGNLLNVSHIGKCTLPSSISLLDVLVVPRLTKNLLSISKLTSDYPVKIEFTNNSFAIQNRKTGEVMAQGRRENDLYVLERAHKAFVASLRSKKLRGSYELWHSRLGHVAFDTISLLNKLGHLSVTSLLPAPVLCSSCQLAKSKRLPFHSNEKRSSFVLDLIHCDLWGPAPTKSTDEFSYYVIFIDDFSRFTWFYPLRLKSDLFNVLVSFYNLVTTQFSCPIKMFQSDGGTEFLNHRVRSFFTDKGIQHRISCPHTPEQNGRAERKHRHITETGLAMLFNAHAPAKYWVDAFSAAVYTINRLPTPLLLNKSPFEMLFSTPPNYENFRPFGCRVFPYLRDYSKNKFSPRSRPCIFIGYSTHYKGYRCLDPVTHRIYITRHAQFDELEFPFTGQQTTSSSAKLVFANYDEPVASSPQHSPNSSMIHSTPLHMPAGPCNLCSQATSPCTSSESTPPASPIPVNTNTDHIPSSQDSPSSSPPTSPQVHQSPHPAPLIQPSHPMVTRAKSGIFKPRYIADLAHVSSSGLLTALFASKDPKGFKSAAKNPAWLAAMDDEITALRINNTWELVPRPKSTNVVGSKWVFRTKYLSDGSVDRLKARLVAQGFTQIPGFDYSHTFSPVVKASTVRIILALAVMNKWPLHQLDVKNAFLNGLLSETVYMEQPPGYVDPEFPHHVCRLKRALYGLKQAPRAWFQRLSTFLCKIGFTCSRADTSLFIFTRGSAVLYLLVYVDDIILTGNQPSLIQQFISRLHQEFAIKDLGKLGYFLGLEVTYNESGIFLSQNKYAHDILARANLLDAKPIATPLAPGHQFTSTGTPLSDVTLYRSLVGALQYLTITRPDLSYVVNQVSQFVHTPTVDHFQAVKRILRYVKGTIAFGLKFSSLSTASLHGYSDADWARCIETRRSTYGYSIFLGDNLVSWSAKKQPTVSRSSCESEYRAMANAAAELVWVTHILRELRAPPSAIPILFCDNKSAIFLSQNPIAHKRAKHIDIDYHFVRELVASGKLSTRFVPTNLQLADIFTKGLPRPLFEHFRSKLHVGPPPHRLRGDPLHCRNHTAHPRRCYRRYQVGTDLVPSSLRMALEPVKLQKAPHKLLKVAFQKGSDTRFSFTDHLYKRLKSYNITTFFDDEEIETGASLKPELEAAIKASRASIIVLSQNYASSTWCLDELVLILEQQQLRNPNYVVIPIFYHVEPTDIRKQQNNFGEAMAKHHKRMETETDPKKRNQWAQKIGQWSEALSKVAGLKGEIAEARI